MLSCMVIIRSQNKHLHIYLDDFDGGLDHKTSKHFFKLIDLMIADNLKKYVTIHYSTHNPYIIAYYITHALAHKNSSNFYLIRHTDINLVKGALNFTYIDGKVIDYFTPRADYHEFLHRIFCSKRQVFVEGYTDYIVLRDLFEDDVECAQMFGYYSLGNTKLLAMIAHYFKNTAYLLIDGDILNTDNKKDNKKDKTNAINALKVFINKSEFTLDSIQDTNISLTHSAKHKINNLEGLSRFIGGPKTKPISYDKQIIIEQKLTKILTDKSNPNRQILINILGKLPLKKCFT